MPSRIAEFLAGQSLRIQSQRAAADAAPGIADADPGPAALTAEAVPVFKTTRDMPRVDSAYALHAGRQIAAICGHDWGRVEKLLAALEDNARIACRINRQPSDLGALDTI
jgi:hypothetical protein